MPPSPHIRDVLFVSEIVCLTLDSGLDALAGSHLEIHNIQ